MGNSASIHRNAPGSISVQSQQRKPIVTETIDAERKTNLVSEQRVAKEKETRLSIDNGGPSSKQQPNHDRSSSVSNDQHLIDQSPPTEHEEDIRNMLKADPHLKKKFEKIEKFKRDLKVDPTLQMMKHKRLKRLSFWDKSYVERKNLGDYMTIIDLPDLINASYEALLSFLGIDCLASLSADMVQDNENIVDICMGLRTIVWNITDASSAFSEKVCKSGMLKHFVKDLEVTRVEDSVDECGNLYGVIETSIAVLHNCSRYPATRQTLREYDTVKHLLPFLKVPSEEGKLLTLFTLATLVDESGNKLLLADDAVFDTLFNILNEAWADDKHRHLGFSVEEFVDGMTGLAKNETNKKLLVEKGAVPILTEILKDGSDDEKEHAVKCIWELAFDKENKHSFKEDDKLMTELNNVKSCENMAVQMAAERALWIIGLDDTERIAAQMKASTSDGKQERSGGHVMISYQWSDQKTMLKVRDSLRQNGFKVWMDVDDMEGSTLDAMAAAVEKASVVLACMSEKYKMSQNCRSEAQYAYDLKKDIVPLLMQRGYKPDGWLGMIKGTKLFFDFSGKYPYDQKLDDLIKELANRGKHSLITDEPDGEVAVVPVVQIPPQAAKSPSVASWSEKDVQNWLTKSGLERYPSLQKLSSDNLVFLKDVYHKAPEFYFTYLTTKLNFSSLDDMMFFTRAIENL